MGCVEHHFKPEIARMYGVDVAIFVQNIYYWVDYNRKYRQNYHEGHYWTYNSQVAFSEVHPYWSRRQIERIIAKCKDAGLLITGCFNSDRRDRTCWYSLSGPAMMLFGDTWEREGEEPSPEDTPGDGGATVSADCIAPNGEMQIPEGCNKYHQTVQPLPDIKPDSKPIPPKSPQAGKRAASLPRWKPERFEQFWTYYSTHGRGENRKAAVKAWDKLKPDDALIDSMGRALQQQVQTEMWRRGVGIPYASTWLNNRRWEDTPPVLPDAPTSDKSAYMVGSDLPLC